MSNKEQISKLKIDLVADIIQIIAPLFFSLNNIMLTFF